MGTSVTLNEQSIVCRTCLKVLDTTGFTYIDDESGYVKNVGNIREMLQFCVPELDLYVSAQPVICYQCLPILVQVYNFKIKCLNGENTIKAYIMRNNLQEYNHVNLNCVLMDDLKLKSQKIKIESRIRHMMLKELPETGETTPDQDLARLPEEAMEVVSQDNSENIEQCFNIILADTSVDVRTQEDQQEAFNKEMNIEVDESGKLDLNYTEQSHQSEGDAPDTTEPENETNVKSVPPTGETSREKQVNIVAVRRDLFENVDKNNQNGNSIGETPKPPKEQHALILNNGMLSQNGRIVIKIDRKRLQGVATTPPKEKEPIAVAVQSPTEQSKSMAPAPPLQPSQVSATSSSSSEDSFTSPQIVAVETVEEPKDSGGQNTYNCNKCSFITNDIIKMYDHNRNYHSFDYTCQHCPFSTSKVELLGKHMTMVHPQKMIPKKNQHFRVTENYACSLCPFSVKSIDLLRSHHLAAHGTNEGPIVLNSAFGNDDSSRHEPRILKRLEYTCDVCPYTTKDKSNLRKHLFTHGTKPLKCDHCSYKCVSPYQLRRHQKQKHAKCVDPRPRNQPYQLPDFKKEKREALDNFKITLETIKRELEKEIST